jgi:photosystem II stability/assembly factor-like uncharacterized protein
MRMEEAAMRLCHCAVQLTLIGSVLIGVRDADAEWFWQNPWPQGNDLRAVAVPDAETVFAVSGGLVLKSTDGGGTWTIQNVRPTGSNLGLADISCVDANTCMAVGFDGGSDASVLRTVDGWATWITTRQSYGPSTRLHGVSCADAQTCAAVGTVFTRKPTPEDPTAYTALNLRTTDGGATWTQQPVGSTTWLESVSCTDTNTCTVVGGYWRSTFQTVGDGYILRTTDGGTTWTTQYTDLHRGRVTAVSCAGSTCVALQGFSQGSATGKILWTTDGGNSWSVSGEFQPTKNPSLFRVSCGDPDACTAAGNGIIMRTADSGATWNEQFRGASSLLGVSFANANTGTVVGAAGFILRTDDGGITWVEQSRGTRTELNAVSFTDASTGTAVGHNGTILRTTDGGATWVEQSSGTTQGLNAVSFIDADTGTAVGANGTILRTIDGGASWVPQSSGTTRSLTGVSCADAQTCTAVGYGPTDLPILRTDDGGITWIQQSGGTGSLLGISCTDVNTCTAVGMSNNGRILLMRTSTGGAIWNIRAYGVYGEDPAPLNAVSCTDFFICTAVGSDGLLRTTDGWQTWTTQQFGSVFGISCPDVDTCTTVGGTIRQTRDGAATWTTQSSGIFRVLRGISCTDADTCTAVGTVGTIVRTGTSQSASYDLTVAKDGNGDGAVTSSSSPAGAGEIDCGNTCTATYASGTVVTLTAQAAIGSTFASWNGCDAVSGATCTVTTSEEKWVGATFTGSQFPLTVWQDGSGSGRVTSDPAGIDCGLDCSETYASGTVVTLVAAAAAGSTFAGWRGCDTVSDMTCTVTTNEEKWVGATFTGSQFPLTVWQDGTGSGRVTSNPAGIDCGLDCSETYASGTVVTLVAAADDGSTFAGWSGCDTVTGMTCTVTTSEEKWVAATFTGSTVE